MVEWRCASRNSGGQCVMTPGISEMQWLLADNLVLPQTVRKIYFFQLVLVFLVM